MFTAEYVEVRTSSKIEGEGGLRRPVEFSLNLSLTG